MQDQAMQHEVLIVDSLMTSLIVTDEEVPAIKQFLKSTSGHLEGSYDVFGRRLEVLKAIPGVPMRGSTFADRGERSCDARIVLRCPEEPRKEVHLRYTLAYHAVARRTKLIARFNPATIVAGNNVGPVAIPEPWRAGAGLALFVVTSLRIVVAPRLRSARRDARSGVQGQRLFSRSSTDIRAGRFRVLRAQWASYIPTPDRLGFLQLLPTIYGHTILSGKGTANNARHLGLIFDPYPRDGTEKQTGVVLQKRYGKKPAWSVEFYDKRARVAQMKQLKTLTEAEIAIISSSVRLDVTAHPPGIISMCKAAQRLIEEFPEACSWSREFVEGSPEATAWWLERAVVALSCDMDGGRVVRRSFAGVALAEDARRGDASSRPREFHAGGVSAARRARRSGRRRLAGDRAAETRDADLGVDRALEAEARGDLQAQETLARPVQHRHPRPVRVLSRSAVLWAEQRDGGLGAQGYGSRGGPQGRRREREDAAAGGAALRRSPASSAASGDGGEAARASGVRAAARSGLQSPEARDATIVRRGGRPTRVCLVGARSRSFCNSSKMRRPARGYASRLRTPTSSNASAGERKMRLLEAGVGCNVLRERRDEPRPSALNFDPSRARVGADPQRL